MIPITAENIQGMAFAMADLPIPVTGVADWAETMEVLCQINYGLAELANHISAHAPDVLTTRADILVSAGSEFVMISDDLLAVRAIHKVDSGGQRTRLDQFTPDSIEEGRSATSETPRFSLQGNRIWFSPAMAGAGTVELWYVRQMTRLLDGNDRVRPEIPFGWDRYVVAYVAAYLLDKEESDSKVPRDIMARVVAEIQDHASSRAGPRCLSRIPRPGGCSIENLPDP
jgi:hypothetical protein